MKFSLSTLILLMSFQPVYTLADNLNDNAGTIQFQVHSLATQDTVPDSYQYTQVAVRNNTRASSAYEESQGRCTQDTREIEARIRQATIDQIRKEISAVYPVITSATADSAPACIVKAKEISIRENAAARAMELCMRDRGLMPEIRCEVDTQEIAPLSTGQFSAAITGESREFKERAEAKQICKDKAVAEANQNAINNCRKQSGSECYLSNPATPSTVNVIQDRERAVFSRNQDIRKCKATAAAMVVPAQQFTCKIQTIVRKKL